MDDLFYRQLLCYCFRCRQRICVMLILLKIWHLILLLYVWLLIMARLLINNRVWNFISLLVLVVGRRKRSTPTAVGRLPTEIHKRSTHTEFLNSSDSSSSRVQFQLEKLFSDVFHGTVDFSYVAFDELGAFSLEKVIVLMNFALNGYISFNF